MVLGNMSRGTVLGSVRGSSLSLECMRSPTSAATSAAPLLPALMALTMAVPALVVTFAYCAREFAAPTHGMMPTIFQPTKGACAVLRLVVPLQQLVGG